jgi:broad specificity phosphatase PhoE
MKYAWILLALCLAACTAEDGPPDYTLYLVRHAEKMKGEGDVELTIAGHTRAAQLSGWLEDRGIEGIWSSNTRRTMQTAAPLQATLGLGIYRYDPALLEELAERLRVAGRNALVVGHSNTTPLLASIVHAVADHRHGEATSLHFADLLRLLLRQYFGEVVVQLQLP